MVTGVFRLRQSGSKLRETAATTETWWGREKGSHNIKNAFQRRTVARDHQSSCCFFFLLFLMLKLRWRDGIKNALPSLSSSLFHVVGHTPRRIQSLGGFIFAIILNNNIRRFLSSSRWIRCAVLPQQYFLSRLTSLLLHGRGGRRLCIPSHLRRLRCPLLYLATAARWLAGVIRLRPWLRRTHVTGDSWFPVSFLLIFDRGLSRW